MISFEVQGDFSKTKIFLDKSKDFSKKALIKSRIRSIAEAGVKALADKTPVRTGKTASSWSYDIETKDGEIIVNWNNSNVVNHVNIAVILQYGHATRNGGYAVGTDYINPALKSVFDTMAADMWRVVVSS